MKTSDPERDLEELIRLIRAAGPWPRIYRTRSVRGVEVECVYCRHCGLTVDRLRHADGCANAALAAWLAAHGGDEEGE